MAEKELRTRVMSLVSDLKAEEKCIAFFKEDQIDERIEDREAVVERQKARDAVKE